MNAQENANTINAAKKQLRAAWDLIESARKLLKPFLTSEQMQTLTNARVECTLSGIYARDNVDAATQALIF